MAASIRGNGNGKRTPSLQHPPTRLSKESNALNTQPLGQNMLQRTFCSPGTLTPSEVMALQRSVGNQTIQSIVGDRVQTKKPLTPVGGPVSGSQMIQPKLAVGPVGDKYEQEADRVAKQVVDTPAPVQRKKHPQHMGHPDDRCHNNSEEILRKPLVRQASKDGFEVDSNFEGHLKQSKTGGAPLPDSLRANFEPKFGADFGDVKVHTDAKADLLNRSIQAKAFTSGQDLFFRRGAYEPGRREGQELIAHELTHVMQQNGAAIRTKRSSTELKGAMSTKEDATIERQADGTSAQEVQMARADPGATHATSSQQTETSAAPISTFLETPSSGGSGHTPIQRRFGFEIEIPMLFTSKKDFNNVPAHGLPAPNPMPKQNLKDVPGDAAHQTGRETNLYNIPTADAHVNVDHNGSLDPLFRRELVDVYAPSKNLTPDQTEGLKLFTGRLIPHQASIMEVVTDAWDEHALSPAQAQQKFEDVTDWVDAQFDAIQGDRQAQVGSYYIGSTATHSTYFQPRLGYFHATYGVKLSQVPQLFQQTTRQKDNLTTYASTHHTEAKHADNVNRTFLSIRSAQRALTKIKGIWPRTGKGFFKNGSFYTKGTKGWNPNIEAAFLGFLTLLDNYLLMFQNSSTDNLGKNKVGMHYYKSDLFDLAQQLPPQIINVLQNNQGVRRNVIKAIGASVGLRRQTDLGGPMAGWSLERYLEQIFMGTSGPLNQDVNNQAMHDPLLAGSINPYSAKLGPEQMGPATNQGLGVVMENRHLEYLDPNYGANQTQSENQQAQEYQQYGPQNHGRSPQDIAMDESTIARLQGPAKRPINEWVPMMMNIYNMLRMLNQ